MLLSPSDIEAACDSAIADKKISALSLRVLCPSPDIYKLVKDGAWGITPQTTGRIGQEAANKLQALSDAIANRAVKVS